MNPAETQSGKSKLYTWLAVAVLAQLAFWYYSMPRPQLDGATGLTANALCCLWAVVSLMLVPLTCATLIHKKSLTDLGLGLGDFTFGWKAIAIMGPLFALGTWVGSSDPQIQAFYPMPGDEVGSSASKLSTWWAAYLTYYIAFEFFYRGYLIRSIDESTIRQRFRNPAFVLIGFQSLCCFIIHIGKPTAELWASLPASIAFGWMAWRSNSIWYGLVIHFAVGIINDVGAM